ncbi:hypothetical protein [Roseibacillus persicicus]|uniref:hypothetical protein n=1 Tax=Roseibacillus persicicus TaxID=454148 RepID=UPI00280F4317|nr:hypothetical protein [Roseibacillus persicicus]MDQ8190248.1 hypothetical protein [Roseibacillus persicicus]
MSAAVDWSPLFPESEIPRILQIVERCASGLKKEHPLELENDICDRLRDLIDQDPEYRDFVNAELQREVPIYDRKAPKQKQLGRGDIQFLHGTGTRKPWPYFLIEAKRLHVDFPSGWNSLVSKYVSGSQGMMCFIKKRYSRDLASGAMLGFVFDGKTVAARDAIHQLAVKKATKLKSVKPHGLSPGNVSEAMAEKSLHSISGRTFVLYHLFTGV